MVFASHVFGNCSIRCNFSSGKRRYEKNCTGLHSDGFVCDYLSLSGSIFIAIQSGQSRIFCCFYCIWILYENKSDLRTIGTASVELWRIVSAIYYTCDMEWLWLIFQLVFWKKYRVSNGKRYFFIVDYYGYLSEFGKTVAKSALILVNKKEIFNFCIFLLLLLIF